MSAAFDTLKFAKRLKEGGFTEQQADTLATAQGELIDANLATKRDLKDLELALRRDIKELETKLARDLKDLEKSLIIKLGGMIAVAVSVVAVLMEWIR